MWPDTRGKVTTKTAGFIWLNPFCYDPPQSLTEHSLYGSSGNSNPPEVKTHRAEKSAPCLHQCSWSVLNTAAHPFCRHCFSCSQAVGQEETGWSGLLWLSPGGKKQPGLCYSVKLFCGAFLVWLYHSGMSVTLRKPGVSVWRSATCVKRSRWEPLGSTAVHYKRSMSQTGNGQLRVAKALAQDEASYNWIRCSVVRVQLHSIQCRSSLEIIDRDPLTGRSFMHFLYPFLQHSGTHGLPECVQAVFLHDGVIETKTSLS